MKSSSIYDNNSNNFLLQQSNVLVTPYAKEGTTATMINSPSSSSNDENEDFNNENSNTYYPATITPLPTTRKNGSKRRSQVRNACVNCQKACKKCDEGRPCQRCIKLGITDTCVDSPRKERKKGFKRGPYRKRSVTTQPHIIPKRDISAAATATPLFTTTVPIHKEESIGALKPTVTSYPKSWSTTSSPIYNDPAAIINCSSQSDLIKIEPLGYYNLPPDNIMYNNFDNTALTQPQQQHNNHDLFMTANQNSNNDYANTSISSSENYNTALDNTSYMQQNQVQQHCTDRGNEFYQTHQRNNSAHQHNDYYNQINSTMVSSPEDILVTNVPNWPYTDPSEHLYYNTQTASQFVPKLGENTILMIKPDNKQQQYHLHQHYIPNNIDHYGNYNIAANRHAGPIYHANQDWIPNSTPPDIYYYPTATRYNNDYY